jgi:hypothetical protein
MKNLFIFLACILTSCTVTSNPNSVDWSYNNSVTTTTVVRTYNPNWSSPSNYFWTPRPYYFWNPRPIFNYNFHHHKAPRVQTNLPLNNGPRGGRRK